MQSTTTTTNGTQPWQERQVNYGLKLLVVFGFLLLVILAMTSGFTLIAVLISSASSGVQITGNFWVDYFPLLLALGVFVVSLYGAILLRPLAAAPTGFKPSYGQIDPQLAGQPFDVRFPEPRLARAFRGKGKLRFEGEQLVLDGTLAPNAAFQLGMVVLLTLVPMLVFRVGLGIIPALLLAFLLGKKKLSRAVPYADVRDLVVKGCRVSFSCTGDKPNTVVLVVSQQDGERLYRELARRFPAALSGWVG